MASQDCLAAVIDRNRCVDASEPRHDRCSVPRGLGDGECSLELLTTRQAFPPEAPCKPDINLTNRARQLSHGVTNLRSSTRYAERADGVGSNLDCVISSGFILGKLADVRKSVKVTLWRERATDV